MDRPTVESMNLNEFAENLGMEQDEFLELIGLFLEASSSDLSRLESATTTGDREMAMDAAHSIKGAAVNLGLMDIYEIATRMETNARENRLTGVAEMIGAIKEKLDDIARSLAAGRQKAVIEQS